MMRSCLATLLVALPLNAAASELPAFPSPDSDLFWDCTDRMSYEGFCNDARLVETPEDPRTIAITMYAIVDKDRFTPESALAVYTDFTGWGTYADRAVEADSKRRGMIEIKEARINIAEENYWQNYTHFTIPVAAGVRQTIKVTAENHLLAPRADGHLTLDYSAAGKGVNFHTGSVYTSACYPDLVDEGLCDDSTQMMLVYTAQISPSITIARGTAMSRISDALETLLYGMFLL